MQAYEQYRFLPLCETSKHTDCHTVTILKDYSAPISLQSPYITRERLNSGLINPIKALHYSEKSKNPAHKTYTITKQLFESGGQNDKTILLPEALVKLLNKTRTGSFFPQANENGCLKILNKTSKNHFFVTLPILIKTMIFFLFTTSKVKSFA